MSSHVVWKKPVQTVILRELVASWFHARVRLKLELVRISLTGEDWATALKMRSLSMRYYDFSSEKLLIHRYNGIKSTFVHFERLVGLVFNDHGAAIHIFRQERLLYCYLMKFV